MSKTVPNPKKQKTPRSARARKLQRLLHIVLIGAFFPCAYLLLTSPMAFALCWLPLFSELTGCTITAEQVIFTLTSSHRKLRFKNLYIEDADGNFLFSRKTETSLRIPGLFEGKIQVTNLKLQDAFFYCRDFYTGERNAKLEFDFNNITCELASLRNVKTAFYVKPENLWIRFDVEHLASTGYTPGARQRFSLDASVQAINDHGIALKQLPFRIEGDCAYDPNFAPLNFSAALLTGDTRGSVYGVPLAGVRYEGRLRLKADPKNKGAFLIETLSLGREGLHDTRQALLSGTGTFSLAPLFADLDLRITAATNHFPFLPQVGKHRLLPVGTRGDGVIRLQISETRLKQESRFQLACSELKLDQNDFLKNTEAVFEMKSDTHFATSSTRIEESSTQIKLSHGQSLSIRNSAPYTLVRRNGSFHFVGNQFLCDIRIRQFELAPLSPFLPIQFTNGTLDLNYTMTRLPGTDNAIGRLDFELKNVSSHENIRNNSIRANMAVSTQGLSHVKQFAIRDCSATCDVDGKRLAEWRFNGERNQEKENLRLHGELLLYPYEVLLLTQTTFSDRLTRLLKREGYERIQNRYLLDAVYNELDGNVSFHARASLDSLGLLDSRSKDVPFETDLSGQLKLKDKAFSTLELSQIQLHAKNLFRGSASVHYDFLSRNMRSALSVDMLSPAVLRGLFRSSEIRNRFLHDFFEELSYKNFQAKIGLSANLGSGDTRIDPLRLSVETAPGETVRLNADRPILGNFLTPKESTLRLTATFDKFDMKFCNAFILDSDPFRFESGKVFGSIEFESDDALRTIRMNNDLLCERFAFSIHERNLFDFGDASVTGKSEFRDFFRDFRLLKMRGICASREKDNEPAAPALSFLSDATIGLTGNADASYEFAIDSISRNALPILYQHLYDYIAIDNFDASGSIRLDSSELYEVNRIRMNLDVKTLDFGFQNPKKQSPRPLDGTVRMDYTIRPKSVEFHSSEIQLADLEKQPVLNLALTGLFSKNPNDDPKSSLDVLAADARFIGQIFLNRKKNEPRPKENRQEAVPPPPESPPAPGKSPLELRREHANWNIENEPAALNLFGFRTSTRLNLKNVRFEKMLQIEASGVVNAENNRFSTQSLQLKVNDSDAQASFAIDCSRNDGYLYLLDFAIARFDLRPCLEYFISPDSKVSGSIDEAELKIRGTGFALDAIDRNLEFHLKASVSDLSMPLTEKSDSLFRRIVLLPILSIPTLLDLLTNKTIRNYLISRFGNNMNMLTGKENATFTTGIVELDSLHSDFLIKKMIFKGPSLSVYAKPGGKINLFYDEIELKTVARFMNISFPVTLEGKLSDPQIDKSAFLLDFFTENAGELITGTTSTITFGLFDRERPEDELDKKTNEKKKPDTSVRP